MAGLRPHSKYVAEMGFDLTLPVSIAHSAFQLVMMAGALGSLRWKCMANVPS